MKHTAWKTLLGGTLAASMMFAGAASASANEDTAAPAAGQTTATSQAAPAADATVTPTESLKAKGNDPQQVINNLASWKNLSRDTRGDIRGNISLPTESTGGVKIAWTSSDPKTVSADGIVTRPAVGAKDATVTLTATATKDGAATATATYQLTVKASPKLEKTTSYLFNYFKDGNGPLGDPGEDGYGTTKGQSIWFSVSKGNNALKWEEVNNHKPIFQSDHNLKDVDGTPTTGGLRDPFIMRSAEGDRFYILATDLCAGVQPTDNTKGCTTDKGQMDWSQMKQTGSLDLEIWESDDLVHWSQQRHIKVSDDNYGMTWAPEATYDPTTGQYIVYWSSIVYDPSLPKDQRNSKENYSRTIYATTRDFVHFSEPQVWTDFGWKDEATHQGKEVIDSTMTYSNGYFYRFSKDNKNGNTMPCGPDGTTMDIYMERAAAKDLYSKDTDFNSGKDGWTTMTQCITQNANIPEGSTRFTRAEGPSILKANEGDASGAKWILFADEYGAQGYLPYTSNDIEAKVWNMPKASELEMPGIPRHGTAMPITQEEADRVRQAYQSDSPLLVTNVEQTTVTTQAGTAPTLPKTVNATYGDRTTKAANVTWDKIDAAKVAKAGTFTVEGTVEGTALKAQATVIVNAAPAQPDNNKPGTDTNKPSDNNKPGQPGTDNKPGTDDTVKFNDVNDATPHKTDIDWLAQQKITEGFTNEDGSVSFGGMRDVVRQDMAAFLYRMAGSPAFDAKAALKTNPFADVDESTPHYKEILWLASTGIAKGYTNKATGEVTFGGMRKVVRQDMAAFLHRYADYKKANPKLGAGIAFTDVDESTPHAEDIAWLSKTGVTKGFDDGTFGGMRDVVRQDMAAFLHRMSAFVG